MGNCLKTQLKENVNNDNLLKIGEIVFTATKFSISNQNLENFTATILSDNTFVGGSTSYVGSSIGQTLLAEQKPTTISIVSKYKITHFEIDATNNETIFNADNFQYCTALLSLSLLSGADNSNMVITGNLATVINTSPLVNILLQNALLNTTVGSIFTKELTTIDNVVFAGLYNKITHVPNEFSELSKLTSATVINIWDSALMGSFEDFVIKSRFTYGKNSGNLKLRNNSAEITFGGVTAYPSWDDYFLIWAPNVSDSTKTDITWGSHSETIDASGNIVS